jgi:CBS domain-containing protein
MEMTMKHRTLIVSDLMTTALVTVRPDELVSEAHANMRLGAFHHLPVVDSRGRLVGIVSDRDILRTLGRSKETTIAEIMTRNPVTVRADAGAHLAARIMLDRTFGSLPVVNEEGLMIGLITQTDFLDVARRALLELPLDDR